MTNTERIVAGIAIAWPIISAVASLIIGWRSDVEWVLLVEKHPKAAACIRLLRAVGLDPVAAVRAVRELFARPTPPLGKVVRAPDQTDRYQAAALPTIAPPPPSDPATPEAKRKSRHDL